MIASHASRIASIACVFSQVAHAPRRIVIA
jgi:hypothetical protein